MVQVPRREKDFDLEAGEILGEELGPKDMVSGAILARSFFTKLCKGLDNADNSINVEVGLCLSNINAASAEKVILPLDKKGEEEEAANLAETKVRKEKLKVSGAKKSLKPPRPPRGLSLNASDHKLVKEIAELAILKRSRIERMKALKKLKASKESSSGLFSSGSMFSILFTIIFCLVLIFQGI